MFGCPIGRDKDAIDHIVQHRPVMRECLAQTRAQILRCSTRMPLMRIASAIAAQFGFINAVLVGMSVGLMGSP
jgi:adenylyl- and sulfurtransferase ThiI